MPPVPHIQPPGGDPLEPIDFGQSESLPRSINYCTNSAEITGVRPQLSHMMKHTSTKISTAQATTAVGLRFNLPEMVTPSPFNLCLRPTMKRVQGQWTPGDLQQDTITRTVSIFPPMNSPCWCSVCVIAQIPLNQYKQLTVAARILNAIRMSWQNQNSGFNSWRHAKLTAWQEETGYQSIHLRRPRRVEKFPTIENPGEDGYHSAKKTINAAISYSVTELMPVAWKPEQIIA